MATKLISLIIPPAEMSELWQVQVVDFSRSAKGKATKSTHKTWATVISAIAECHAHRILVYRSRTSVMLARLIQEARLKGNDTTLIPAADAAEFLRIARAADLGHAPFARKLTGVTADLYASILAAWDEVTAPTEMAIEMHPARECLASWEAFHGNRVAVINLIRLLADPRRTLNRVYQQAPEALVESLVCRDLSGGKSFVVDEAACEESIRLWLVGRAPTDDMLSYIVCPAILGDAATFLRKDSRTSEITQEELLPYCANYLRAALRAFYSSWLAREYHPEHAMTGVKCLP